MFRTFVVACTAVLCASLSSAWAGPYPEVLFILDSSGSMQESVGSERKIDAAKRVMDEVVPALEPEVRVGLVAYGHRQSGSCSDIETLVPAGSTDREYLLHRVRDLQPLGKTPIARAILSAARMLKTKDAVTSVVLVSDGVETCGGDPCAVVQQLRAAGIKLVVHTVGLDVDKAAAKQLQCIAKKGGGEYFSAADGDDLLAALKAVTAKVADQVAAARVENVSMRPGLGKLAISLPEDSVKSLVSFQLLKPDSDEVVKNIDPVQANSLHPLRSGEYDVVSYFATPNMGRPERSTIGRVSVVKGETRQLELGAIALNLPEHLKKNDDWKQRLHVKEVVIFDAGTDNLVARVRGNGNGYYNYVDKPVPAGIYDVKFHYGDGVDAYTTVATDVSVQPGRTATATLNSGIQFSKADEVRGWRLYRRLNQTADAAEDQGAATTPRELALEVKASGLIIKGRGGKTDQLWFPYLLPPGEFDIEVDYAGMNEPLPVAEGVKIEPGQLLQFDLG